MLALLIPAAFAAAVVSTNQVYDFEPKDDAVSGKPAYTVQSTTEKQGDAESVKLVTHDSEGKLYSRQEVHYLKGVVSDYVFESEKAKLKIEVREGKVRYDSVIEGKKSDAQHDLPKNFVIGTSLRRYIEAHYDELAAGKEVEIELGLPVFGKTLAFKLAKVQGQEKSVVAGERIKVEFKPSSIIVRTMMPPAHYYLNAKSKRLVRYVGPTEYVRPGEKKGFVGTVEFGS